MKILGSEVTQDSAKLEMEIRTNTAEREKARVDRNTIRKLTPVERHEKKLFGDPTTQNLPVVAKPSVHAPSVIYGLNDVHNLEAVK